MNKLPQFSLTYLQVLSYIFIFFMGYIPAIGFELFLQKIVVEKNSWSKIIAVILNVFPMIFTLIIARYNASRKSEVLKWNFTLSIKLLPLLIIITICMMLISSALSSLIPHDVGVLKTIYDEYEKAFTQMLHPQWVFILATCVFAPIFEELFLRGLLLKGLLTKAVNDQQSWLAIIFTAFIFGVIHANPWQFVAAFIAGTVLGFVYYRTRSILNTIFMHAINNIISVVLFIQYDTMEPTEFENYPFFINIFILAILIVSLYYLYIKTKEDEQIDNSLQ